MINKLVKYFHNFYKLCKPEIVINIGPLFTQALHPGSCKQSVPPALAIFHEYTVAALLSYFPERIDSAGFLQLFDKW